MWLCLVLLSFSNSGAQDFNSILTAAMDQYQSTESYELKSKYIIYKDSLSQDIKDNQTGVFLKSGANGYFKMAKSEIIYTKDYFLKISHQEKMLLYTEVTPDQASQTGEQLPFHQFLNVFKTKKLKDQKSHWICELSNPMNLSVPYLKIKLYISKKSKLITKQVYYFSTSVERRYNSEITDLRPERLEIVQQSFKTHPTIANSLFDIATYLVIDDNTITTTSHNKNYKIIVR